MSGTRIKKEKDKKKIVILAVVIAAIVIAGLFLWKSCGAEKSPFAFDDLAKNGYLEGRTPEDLQNLVNKQVEEGMFNISINSVITFKNGEAEGNMRIENIEANRYYMVVSLVLDDTGEKVYESKGIKPGQFIENAPLLKPLAKGNYPATAVFSAVDQDSLREIGRAQAQITITVLN